MRCPYCSASDSKVIDSRAGDENKVIRRRRECLVCRKRFSTYERLEPLPLMVIKSNGTREPFDSAKVRAGLMKACEKRPISIDTIEKIVAEVEYAISNYVMEVPSKIIGEMVLDKLEKIDTVSYLRFASVFKNFSSTEDFIGLASMLKNRTGEKSASPGAVAPGSGATRRLRSGAVGSMNPFGNLPLATQAKIGLPVAPINASIEKGGDSGRSNGGRSEIAEGQSRDGADKDNA